MLQHIIIIIIIIMDAHRHEQKGALAPPNLLLWKCYKVFCALVVTAKR